ncbi:MAG: acetyl/propionyl/methylcrotonyl-CoA carboxylase subunit alpha [Actinomycetes bacterium]
MKRVLVANRGEIAVRVVRAARELGLESVVAVSAADRDSLAARLADRAVCIGPARPADSYLNQDALLAAALGTGADAVHPGYGFLAENAAFAEACEKEGLTFVGPRSESVHAMGNKLAAREAAARAGVPLVPGSDHIAAFSDAASVAGEIGYPVLFKAAAGGGGRGIRIVHDESGLEAAFRGASAEAAAAFGDSTLYLERYVTSGRHIEVQVIGDRTGRVLHLGERDCSLQRRYQKVLEEAPAAAVPDHARRAIHRSAVLLAEAIGYLNAGTVEFLYDEDRDEHYFLEMNTRIQVEHPVTEMITGLDLVRLQLQVAAGDPLPLTQDRVTSSGHAIECRINAEAPDRGFTPSPGRITRWEPPEGPGVRLDTHCFEGYVVPPFYDSLLGKLVVHGSDRTEALARTRAALRSFTVEGVATTIPFHSWLLDQDDVVTGRFSTRWLEARLPEFTG